MATSSPVKEKHSYERQEKKGTLTLLNLNIFGYNTVLRIFPTLMQFELLYDIIVVSIESDELITNVLQLHYCAAIV